MTDEIMTTQEAADFLGITQRAVNALISRETLEAKKFGIQWLVSRESVEAYKQRKEANEASKK